MIYTLTGSNEFLLKAALNRLKHAFVQEHGDLALEQFDAEEASYEQLVDALQNLPFLSSKKLVIIRQAAAQKQLLENLEHIFSTVPDSTDVILVIPKVDKRARYAKLLQKQTQYQEYTDLDEAGLARWLVAEAEAAGGKLATHDARFLVERVGTNQALLAQELQKSLAYNPHITRASIELLCDPLPQSTIFELMDAAFAGKTKYALELYEDQRRQKVEPLAIMGMIAWQLNILAIVKTAGERSVEDIAKQAKLHPFVVRKNNSAAKHLTLTKLKGLIYQAYNLDVRLKREAINADDALKQFLFELTNISS